MNYSSVTPSSGWKRFPNISRGDVIGSSRTKPKIVIKKQKKEVESDLRFKKLKALKRCHSC